MTALMAEKLTGAAQSHKILSGLSRDHYFTDWRPLPEPVFQYHPLFREFLLAKAREEFAESELSDTKRFAASLLADSGNVEDAAGLFSDAKDWEGLTKLVLSHAQTLVIQGRSRILEQWISGMPKEIVEDSPWLLCWFGICRMAYNPYEAREYLEKAFLRFNREGDVSGMFLSWASIIDAFIYAGGAFKPLDHWIATADKLIADYPEFSSPEIEARVAAGMLMALFWRQPWRKDMPIWAERVRQIILHHPSVQLRMMFGNPLIVYYLWIGDFAKAHLLIDELRPLGGSKESDPLTHQQWRIMEAAYYWMTADHKTCMEAVTEGLKGAEESGIHIFDLHLLCQGVYSGLSLGDPSAAETCLKKISGINSPGLRDKTYHAFSASVAWYYGDFKKAIEHGKVAVKLLEDDGGIMQLSTTLVELALSLFDAGQHEEASRQLAEGGKLARGINHIEYMYLIYGARFAFDLGNEEQGLALLKQGLALGAQQGYVNMSRWNNETMSRLCAKALEYGIEVEYVEMLIRKRKLMPPNKLPRLRHPSLLKRGSGGIDNWPYPIKIYTLGRFEIMKDGKSIESSGKVQKKPLDMLKAIIALGGEDVAEEQLTDAFWPDAEGDATHSTFKSTLHRLRKLIENDDALTIKEGRVTLDSRYCWVDAWAFQRLLAEIEGIGDDRIRQFVEKGVSIYHGDFLASDKGRSWAVSMRERLKGGFIRLVKVSGQSYIQAGEWEEAIKLYQKAIEINDLEEEFYRALMLIYGKLGRRADVQTTYHRLGRLLSSVLSVEPSLETKAAYKKAMAG